MTYQAQSAKPKHWSGQICPESGTYGQYSDVNNAYAGASYDRYVARNDRFPPQGRRINSC